MSFKIIVDSCCDLTVQMRQDPCFVKVPLSMTDKTAEETGRIRES